MRDRKTRAERVLRVDRVINCTGPETDCRRIDNPLIKNLLAQGFARPDPLFLGLDADSKGALIDSSGVPSTAAVCHRPRREKGHSGKRSRYRSFVYKRPSWPIILPGCGRETLIEIWRE